MVRPRFLQNPRITQIILENNDLEEFTKTLRYGQSVSEALRLYVQECVMEHKKKAKSKRKKSTTRQYGQQD